MHLCHQYMVDQQSQTKTTLVIASILYSHWPTPSTTRPRFPPLNQGLQPMDTGFLPLDQGFQPLDQCFLRTSSAKKAQVQYGFHYCTMKRRGAFVRTPFFTARLCRISIFFNCYLLLSWLTEKMMYQYLSLFRRRQSLVLDDVFALTNNPLTTYVCRLS